MTLRGTQARAAAGQEPDSFHASNSAELTVGPNSATFSSELRKRQEVLFTRDIFAPENDTLASVLRDAPALVVTTPSVERLYGDKLRTYFARQAAHAGFLVLDCREATKTYDQVLAVCHEAARLNLERRSQIVAVGGGVCTDICGFAAAVYRRGISHIKVPTTLVGLIDAGIGLKNGVNLGDKKNLLGTFSPPECSILDAAFLHTLDARQLRAGLAESLKMGVVCDWELFLTLERDGLELLRTRFAHPYPAAARVIKRSVDDMLAELSRNPFEVSGYERAVDFGHTFSPYFESASQYTTLHGEAVAMDMALSTVIAARLGVIAEADAERIVSLIERLGLPLCAPRVDPERLWASLRDVAAHRNGHLNLVVPRGIGSHVFIKNLTQLSVEGLAAATEELEQREVQSRGRTVVS